MRVVTRRAATLRRARPRWRHSQRAGAGSERHVRFWRAKRTFNDAGSRRRRSRMTDPERTYAGSNFAMQYVLLLYYGLRIEPGGPTSASRGGPPPGGGGGAGGADFQPA